MIDAGHKRETHIAMRRVLANLPVPNDVYVTTPEEIKRRGWIVGLILRETLGEDEIVYERPVPGHACMTF